MDFYQYFQNKDLTKIPNKGLHYEQKTTPDLLWCISSVILDITKDNRNLIFSDNEIRGSSLFNNLMQDYFSKAPQNTADNEYNKVSSYQLGLLAYSGILEQVNDRPKQFKMVNLQALEYMSLSDFNASKFLIEYTEKFLIDNNLINYFENYKNNPNQENYNIIKDKYWEWALLNTRIRGADRKHTYRVLNKIFNVYCYKHRIPGEDKSKIINGPCPYSFLIYNRTNFRDENMPVGMTRRDYINSIISDINNNGVVASVLIQKAKDDIRRKYNGISEIQDIEFIPNHGVHIHHILPQSSYKEFAAFRENLIALTPGQHFSLAHIQGNTQRISPDFQKICLRRKFQHIKESIQNGENFYMLNNFIKLINSAFTLQLSEESTFNEIDTALQLI